MAQNVCITCARVTANLHVCERCLEKLRKESLKADEARRKARQIERYAVHWEQNRSLFDD